MTEEPTQDGEQTLENSSDQAVWNGLWGRLNIRERIRQEGSTYFVDPKFRRHYMRYLYQSLLATVALACVLLFVDSLSSAAFAAGIGSSIVGIFVIPSGATSRIRAVVGGHTIALIIGSLVSLLLFAGPIESFVESRSEFHALAMAFTVGLLILIMAVTDTEHPPAAGIAIGMSSRVWSLEVFSAILGAVLVLALFKLVLRPQLRDLI
ncbi:MAG: HPP family protein [Chloroflexi bacterium]|nr:HPP family protein [Chloroflexota bacterium]